MTTQPVRPDQLPPLTLGGRTYEFVPFHEPGETHVSGDEMVRRAERLEANLGEDDGLHILAHRSEIPLHRREIIVLVFPAWRHPVYESVVAYVRWIDGRWIRGWGYLASNWDRGVRLVRRRLPTGEAGK